MPYSMFEQIALTHALFNMPTFCYSVNTSSSLLANACKNTDRFVSSLASIVNAMAGQGIRCADTL